MHKIAKIKTIFPLSDIFSSYRKTCIAAWQWHLLHFPARCFIERHGHSSFQSARGYYSEKARRPLDQDKSPTICYSSSTRKLFWCPRTWFRLKRMARRASVFQSINIFMIWLTTNRYEGTFDPGQTVHIAESLQFKSSREALKEMDVMNEEKKTYPMGKSTSAPWSVIW